MGAVVGREHGEVGWGREPLTEGFLEEIRKMGAKMVGSDLLKSVGISQEGGGAPFPAASELDTPLTMGRGKGREANEPCAGIGAPNSGLLRATSSSRRFLARRWREMELGGLLELGGVGGFIDPPPELGERFEAFGFLLYRLELMPKCTFSAERERSRRADFTRGLLGVISRRSRTGL